MTPNKTELVGYLSIIKDPRLDRKKLHQLTDILFIAVCASLCGCDTWEDIHLFAEIREEWLKQYVPLSNGIPSAQNLSILRRMVLNVLKQETSKGSLKGKRKKASWSEEYLVSLLPLMFNF